MTGAGQPRLLLLLPTTTYRAEAYVEAARRLGVTLSVASEQDSAFSHSEPDGLLTLDFSDPVGAADRVCAFSQEHPLSAVIGIDDVTVVVAAHASRALGLPHNPVAAVEAAGDKHRQRVLCRDGGIRVPSFALHTVDDDPEQIAQSARYPCVLKPLHLAASRGVMRADSAIEFRDAFARLRAILGRPDVATKRGARDGILVEGYVEGPEFALEGILVDGALRVLALFDKPDPLEGPFFAETIYVTPSRQPMRVQEALTDCAQSAVRALNLRDGPVHVELRYNDRGAWLIELAARPIGGKCGQVLRFGADRTISLEQVVMGHVLGRFRSIPEREPDAVAVMMLPVPRAGTLEDFHGVVEAMSVPLVTDVIITVHRGQELLPLPEDSRYLGFIFARGATPEAVEAAVRQAHELLEFQIAS